MIAGDVRRNLNATIFFLKGVMKMKKRFTVLIVDDDVVCNDSLAFLLHHIVGMETVQAYDAYQALEAIQGGPVDIVISDVCMPGMNGIELLSEIKKINEELPIIMMSGYTDTDLFNQAVKRGAIGWLAKPLDHEVLMSMLRAALCEKRTESVPQAIST